jgi:hypothetical protein
MTRSQALPSKKMSLPRLGGSASEAWSQPVHLRQPHYPLGSPKRSVPLFGSVPDLGVPLPIKNPFVYPR